MKDQAKTKQTLIGELASLRKRIAQLEQFESERRQVEKALRASENRYYKLFQHMSSSVAIYEAVEDGADFVIRDFNAAAERLEKIQKEEILGRRVTEVFPGVIDFGLFSVFQRVWKTGNSEDHNVSFYQDNRISGWRENHVYKLPSGEVVAIYDDVTDRKQAECALRESEEKYRALFENAGEAIFVAQDGRVAFLNPMTAQITGYSSEEITSRPFVDFIHADDRDMITDRHTRRLQGEDIPRSYTFRMLRKNGGLLWVQLDTVLINWQGKPATLNFMTDITERKRIEDALRESEHELRALFKSMLNAFVLFESVFDRDGNFVSYRFVYINDAYERITGVKNNEVRGKTVHEVWPNTEASWVKAYGDVATTGIPSTFDMYHEPTEKLYHCNAYRPWDTKGRFCVVFEDITERRRAEEEIQKANILLNSIVENIPNMIFLKDAGELRFTRFNRAGEELLGHSRDDLLGKNDYDFFPKEQADFFTQKDREVLRGKVIVDIQEEPLQTRDRGERILHTKKVPILNANGEPEYLMGISEDITDRKRAEAEKRRLEERLRRAEKMEALGQLAGGVAHDLNNVLGVLSGYSELLLAEIPEGQKARRHVEKILQSTEKGAAIIQDLLTLARRGVISEEVIQVNDIISGFIKTPAFENIRDYHPGVSFRMDCDPNLLNIKGSPVHLEKTLMNLVSNAAESISGEGEVVIRTENRYLDKAVVGYDEVREGDYVVLSVSDTGTGISDEHREKIFEPFYTKKAMGRSGTGLGLTIVWGTVKDHNGYIDVSSRVGEGTTFTLYFPATRDEQTAPPERTPVERYMGRGETVLVVDDIAEQRDVASGLLRKLGYRVHSVSSGEEAIEYLKQNRADILILDMIMAPGMDGMEAYRRILAMHPKQKAILVSGFSETDRVRKAQLLGAGVYVKKPYVMETIGLALRKELDR
ncbi:MAG TPA: PAS domain S-box protein, partial [Smithellaceae bacterium]|nr:PAS domain S-box protein [Smithellaceae bacterium]